MRWFKVILFCILSPLVTLGALFAFMAGGENAKLHVALIDACMSLLKE